MHSFTRFFLIALVLVLAGGMFGCASTTIETPIGTYRSTRDSKLDELVIVIDRQADGSERTEVRVGGAGGEASGVIQSQADFMRALFDAAFAAGMRAATMN